MSCQESQYVAKCGLININFSTTTKKHSLGEEAVFGTVPKRIQRGKGRGRHRCSRCLRSNFVLDGTFQVLRHPPPPASCWQVHWKLLMERGTRRNLAK
ncbi:hypothetical protein CEXT_234131 [Caerostris extrusa]|uniref:Uncharacterized protein n=1 Tax=Caerostris extrusa TaxID=172846 RepID=A0AAV4X081_CAEEX|nr:hypothetical protein CEXT_234131 [Caerostris extrusa]